MANHDFLGPMPPIDAYDPEGMSTKKKQKFEMWYSEQVQNEYEFNMRREMDEYCISDVKLLKAGCQKFQAEFNPMEKCLTIATKSKLHLDRAPRGHRNQGEQDRTRRTFPSRHVGVSVGPNGQD